MWYNSSTGTLRGPAVVEAWSSGAAMPTSHGIKYAAGAGTQTAGLFFGGNDNPPGTRRDETFEYNGSGWTVGGSLTTPWYLGGGMGTQTAGLQAFGKTTGMVSEAFEYNGTSWTAAGDGNTGRQAVGSAGSQTAGLCFGGVSTPPTTWHALTESYNGTGWSVENTLTTARNQVGFLGDVSTSALCIGGETPPSWATIANVEEWGGSSWTAGTAFPAVTQLGVGTGSVTDGLYYGTAPNNAEAFNYDGTTWTAIANLGTGRDAGVRCGTGTSAALLASGSAPTSVVLTEEYNKSTTAYTAAAWASGGTLNTGRDSYYGGSRNGTQTAFRTAGGYASTSNVVNNEAYDGTSFSEEADLNTARRGASGAGTEPSALYFGGYTGTVYTGATEEWGGSSWTTSPGSMSTARDGIGSCGTQTAALAFGGNVPPRTNVSEEYNGTSWTSGGNMPGVFSNRIGLGIQTAALAVGGETADGPTGSTQVDSYNGTAFSTLPGALTAAKQSGGGAGTTTSALIFGGSTPPSGTATNTSIGFDGTSWSTRPNMAQTKLHWSGGAGTATAAIGAGGNPPNTTNNTEEFTGETSAANIEDFTTS
jgi:hypothetical protein